MNINYSQPDFFRFGQDSIWLAEFATNYCSKEIRNNAPAFQPIEETVIFDLFSGCGVVGIEFYLKAKFLNKIAGLYFIDKNSTLCPYLEKNINSLSELNPFNNGGVPLKYDFIIGDLLQLSSLDLNSKRSNVLNILLANPPYYLNEESRPSPDEQRNVARIWTRNECISFFRSLDDWDYSPGYFFCVQPASRTDLIRQTLKHKKIRQSVELPDQKSIFVIF